MLCHLFLILICNTRFCVTPLVQFLRHCTLHESGKGLEIERTHKETRVIRKEISLVPFIQTWGSPYLPNCCTRTSAQAGGKLPYQQWSQCPTANHQAGEAQELTECFVSWPETVLQIRPRNKGRPGPYKVPGLQHLQLCLHIDKRTGLWSLQCFDCTWNCRLEAFNSEHQTFSFNFWCCCGKLRSTTNFCTLNLALYFSCLLEIFLASGVINFTVVFLDAGIWNLPFREIILSWLLIIYKMR